MPSPLFGTSSLNQGSRVRATFQLRPYRRVPEHALCLSAGPPATIVYLTALGFLSPITAALVCLIGCGTGLGTSSRLAPGARCRHSLQDFSSQSLPCKSRCAQLSMPCNSSSSSTERLTSPCPCATPQRGEHYSIPQARFFFFAPPWCVCFLPRICHIGISDVETGSNAKLTDSGYIRRSDKWRSHADAAEAQQCRRACALLQAMHVRPPD